MSIFEYNEELTMKQIRMDEYEEGRKDGRKEGRASGRVEDLLKLLVYKGTLPERVKDAIHNQKDDETLTRWFDLALRADTVEEFCREAGL